MNIANKLRDMFSSDRKIQCVIFTDKVEVKDKKIIYGESCVEQYEFFVSVTMY
jgi:hypothetical protein